MMGLMTEELRGPGADGGFVAVSEVFRSLASPVRVAIIDRLAHGEACVHELVEELDISQPLASQHLRILRGANLVTRVRRGREVAYALADEHVAHIVGDALRHAGEPAPVPEPGAVADADHPDRPGHGPG